MEMVKQRSNNDCGVACAAMIIGCSYEEALESFCEATDSANTHSIDQFFRKHGLTIYVREYEPDSDAVGYIFTCRSPAGSHWVAMDVEGNMYDPSPTPLKEYHGINLYEVRPLKK